MSSFIRFAICGLLLFNSLSAVLSSKAFKAAPYFMPLDSNPQNIDDIIANSGIRDFIFAFALAPNEGECLPLWNGNKGQSIEGDTKVLDMINQVRRHGGDVSISFGGYNGIELGHACSSAEELAKAYQIVIDKYQLTAVDFDIEGDDLGAEDEESRRFKAIKMLKDNANDNGKSLFVSLTLPCTSEGLSGQGKDEIKRSIAVQEDLIDLYTIMAFDYGGQADSMASDVEHVMEQVHQQLKSMRTDLTTDEQVYEHTGMILMNGHTDQQSELFTLETFSELLEYAKKKKLGRLSYWALNRDRPCPEGANTGWASGTCSSISQNPWDFTKIIAKFDSSNDKPDHPTPTTPETVTQEPIQPDTDQPLTPSPTGAPPTTVDCSNTDEQYFPYPNDCHKYIRCYNDQQHVKTCQAGLIYDPKLKVCNWERDVDRPEC